MEEAFRTFLLANAAVVAVVGDRIAWDALPRADALPAVTLPAVTLHLVSGGRSYTVKGRSTLRGPTVQINCWGSSSKQAGDLAELIVEACDVPAGTIKGVFVVAERGDWRKGDGPRSDGARDFYHAGLDVRVWFKPA
jgi:hypothetical protein